MKSEEEVFREYLNKKGLKFTSERKKILKEVFSSHEHFDVEGLYAKLKQKDADVSRSTIYRTIPLLLESGLVREATRCKEHTYYEHIYGHRHHSHLVCIECGKVIEFEDDKIREEKERICEKYNFESVEFRFGIRGYCNECQQKNL